jgi:hypothetical protein
LDLWSSHSAHLGVLETEQIWLEVVDYALVGSRKGDASDQQDDEHQVGKCGSKINNLEKKQVKFTPRRDTSARRSQGISHSGLGITHHTELTAGFKQTAEGELVKFSTPPFTHSSGSYSQPCEMHISRAGGRGGRGEVQVSSP